MANTNQGLRQESVRAVTGTTLSYNGDWIALFRLSSIDTGSFNGDMLAWINLKLSATHNNLSGAQAAYAANQGFDNWGSMGTFTPGGGGGYSAEATQFLSRIADPGTNRKNAYAAIIDGLVSGGIWSKLDCLWILAADTASNAIINLKSSSFTLTPTSSPTFAADQGYTASSGASYLDTNYNPSTAGGVFVQNSAHYSVWVRTGDAVNQNRASFGSTSAGTAGESHVFVDTGGNAFTGRCNSQGGAGNAAFGDSGTNVGFYHTNRSSSSALQGYFNGSAVGAGVTFNSATPSNSKFNICRSSDGQSILSQISAVTIGSSLDSTEAATLYSALNTNKWW